MNRIDRLSAILTQLQSKRLVTARAIADRFDISLRTVYRDVKALGEAGIPIIGEAGAGYSIMEGYRMPPIMFTKDEAIALLMAEKISQNSTDEHTGQQLLSAMMKIRAVLRSTEKELLAEIDDHIAIRVPRSQEMENKSSNILQNILHSIADQKVLEIKYKTIRNAIDSTRNIEPIGIYYANQHWYVIAFCQLRTAYRTFRVERINSIRLKEDKFHQKHPSLHNYLERIKKKDRLIKVVLLIDKSIEPYISEEKFHQGFVLQRESNDHLEMTFMVSSIFGIARWIMKLGGHVTIIEPSDLRDHVVKLAKAVLFRQKDP